MSWLTNLTKVAMFVVSVVAVSSGQTKQLAKFNIEQWDYPDTARVFRVYEQRFNDLAEGRDTINQIYLKQSIWWRPDTNWNWTEIKFDSVIGRGDNRKALITLVSQWTSLPTDVYYGGMYVWPNDSLATKYVKYCSRDDSLVGIGSWMGYTTRIYDQYWIPLFSRGQWREVDYYMLQDSTVVTVSIALHKVVGLDALSRALLWIHASRKPMYEYRWWQK